MTVVPIHELTRRIPEAGRIRMGIKVKGQTGKINPRKLNRFRFTSANLDALAAIAAAYGGEVKPWQGADKPVSPDDHEVIVREPKVAITLPPDPLGGTPIYEHWLQGGCMRRCDGVDCAVPSTNPNEGTVDVECLCRQEGRRLCKPVTRLNVILRGIPFTGVWRLESKGDNAFRELPGMVEMAQLLQGEGMTCAHLTLVERVKETPGQPTKKFLVPAIGFDETIEALVAGAGNTRALAPATQGNLPALAAAPDWWEEGDEGAPAPEDESDPASMAEPVAAEGAPSPDPDDEIAEAEIVDEDEPPPPPEPIKRKGISRAQAKLHATLGDVMRLEDVTASGIVVDDLRHGLVRLVTKGATDSSSQLSGEAMHEAIAIADDLAQGRRRLVGTGLRGDGTLRVTRPKATA